MRLVFQILIGLSALFIAGCSAYFSVKGIGLLFAGAAVPVMVMAASLEAGKLVAASLLYRHWSRISIPVRAYLLVAVGVLIGITSLGIYGYLARAYERTNQDVALLQKQIESVEREIADTEKRIDASRNLAGKSTDAERADITRLREQVGAEGKALEQSLARLEERRKAARDKRDRETEKAQLAAEKDSKTFDQSLARLDERRKTAKEKSTRDGEALAARAADATKILTAGLASEDAAIAALNERLAVLDRAVDAYTKEGGAGFLKDDKIKRGQLLREEQKPQRDAIAEDVARHRVAQDALRATHAAEIARVEKLTTELDEPLARSLAAIDEDEKALRKARETAVAASEAKSVELAGTLAKELGGLDEDEKALRKSNADTIAAAEKQLAALQARGDTFTADSGNQIEAMYQRIRSGNEEIRLLREKVASTDIGSYRFVARAFNAPVDDVVKWLMLVIVLVFDPLAVALTIGFNIAISGDRRPATRGDGPAPALGGATGGAAHAGSVEPALAMSRGSKIALSVLLLLMVGGAIAVAAMSLVASAKKSAMVSHKSLVPAESFAVMSMHPALLQRSGDDKTESRPGLLLGSSPAFLREMTGPGFDPGADLLAFVKYPAARADKPSNRPTIICGVVAKITDPAAAEASLSRCADAIGQSLRPTSAPALTRNRVMVNHGRGRYLDPEGGFFSYALTPTEAVLMIEVEGDADQPAVEREIRDCLAQSEMIPSDASVIDARRHVGVEAPGAPLTLWVDAARCFTNLPKSAAAQSRYQRLQKYLDFNLQLTLEPADDGQVRVTGRYTYQGERFATGNAQPLLDVLNKLGPADASGIAGRLIERGADTLDFESLIERLRTAMTEPRNGPKAQVVVEKTIDSPRDAHFVLRAKYDPKVGSPMAAAIQSLSFF